MTYQNTLPSQESLHRKWTSEDDTPCPSLLLGCVCTNVGSIREPIQPQPDQALANAASSSYREFPLPRALFGVRNFQRLYPSKST